LVSISDAQPGQFGPHESSGRGRHIYHRPRRPRNHGNGNRDRHWDDPVALQQLHDARDDDDAGIGHPSAAKFASSDRRCLGAVPPPGPGEARSASRPRRLPVSRSWSDPEAETIILVTGSDPKITKSGIRRSRRPDRPDVLSLDALIQEPARVATLSRQELAELYRQVAHLEVDLRALLLAHPAEASRADDAARLLTLPEVATILTIPKSKAYELARRGELPTVVIPGGKYVRVRQTDLAVWIDRHELPLVTSRRDQAHIPAAPKGARTLTGAARHRDGHHQGERESVGGGRAPDLGASGPFPETPGRDPG
jgi:excisionase family DNA binding protein